MPLPPRAMERGVACKRCRWSRVSRASLGTSCERAAARRGRSDSVTPYLDARARLCLLDGTVNASVHFFALLTLPTKWGRDGVFRFARSRLPGETGEV
eukprot:916229-Prymnesium_polylepis.1